jgi:hypothetical protein
VRVREDPTKPNVGRCISSIPSCSRN